MPRHRRTTHKEKKSKRRNLKAMLTHIPFPALPAPPSWFPGHMLHFARTLPALLTRTDVVLELRDARLPLTSINRNFEGPFVRPAAIFFLRFFFFYQQKPEYSALPRGYHDHEWAVRRESGSGAAVSVVSGRAVNRGVVCVVSRWWLELCSVNLPT